jgi:hypothetical protein
VSLNRYLYAADDPCNHTDPTGRSIGCIFGKVYNPFTIGEPTLLVGTGGEIAGAGAAVYTIEGISVAAASTIAVPIIGIAAFAVYSGFKSAADECAAEHIGNAW